MGTWKIKHRAVEMMGVPDGGVSEGAVLRVPQKTPLGLFTSICGIWSAGVKGSGVIKRRTASRRCNLGRVFSGSTQEAVAQGRPRHPKLTASVLRVSHVLLVWAA